MRPDLVLRVSWQYRVSSSIKPPATAFALNTGSAFGQVLAQNESREWWVSAGRKRATFPPFTEASRIPKSGQGRITQLTAATGWKGDWRLRAAKSKERTSLRQWS